MNKEARVKTIQARRRPGGHGAIGLLLLTLGVNGAAHAVDNLRMHGALVAEPCVIQPGDEDVELDFGTLVDKYLYLNQRTQGQPFELRLTECDLSLGKTVSITFKGTENAQLPGLLALAASSQARGIAIGMETPQGQPLSLNSAGGKYPLQNGSTVIGVQAYVRGEPEAIAKRTIGRGAFSAIATFSLDYQ
ncbi:fimbrial protein [Serratia marcescens]|jgi:type 1 fimbria pilin|nr:fimbrial protein [Serratia marcescens]BEM33749.1 exotoxin [Serratia marcescens]BEM53797.1 exotoxin [Serratia marcescens]BEM72958.1 exotoxin [Serratia marcescens]HEJ7933188.1 fimbrial protein [Serratia marcescens]